MGRGAAHRKPGTWEVCKQEAQEVRAVLGYRKSEASLGPVKPWRENLKTYEGGVFGRDHKR